MKSSIKEKLLLYTIVRKKDPEAFGRLYDTYVENVYRFVFFKINNVEEAQDLTSDVFLRLWQYLIDGENKKIENVRALIYAIARNVVIDAYRERARQQTSSLEQLPEMIAHGVSIEERVHTIHAYEKIVNSMKLLKQEYQEVILFRFIEELSVAEIAKILGKSKTNVRVLIHRALKKLKEFEREV